MARRRKARFYNGKCNGCGKNRPIAHLSLELCSQCTSFVYRVAGKLVMEGGEYLPRYYKQYVEKPALRYRFLIDTGVVHEQADARCVRDGMRKRYRRPRLMKKTA